MVVGVRDEERAGDGGVRGDGHGSVQLGARGEDVVPVVARSGGSRHRVDNPSRHLANHTVLVANVYIVGDVAEHTRRKLEFYGSGKGTICRGPCHPNRPHEVLDLVNATIQRHLANRVVVRVSNKISRGGCLP